MQFKFLGIILMLILAFSVSSIQAVRRDDYRGGYYRGRGYYRGGRGEGGGYYRGGGGGYWRGGG